MRTLVKGQTNTTQHHKRILTQQTRWYSRKFQNPRKTPQTDRGANFKSYYPARTNQPSLSRLRVYRTSHDGATASQHCAQTTTTPSSDHTLNNQLHIASFSPLFQQDTYVSHQNAGSSKILASTSMARGHAGQSGVSPGSWETLCTSMPLPVLNRYRNWAWRVCASLRARFRLL
ncbi:hypothetical protein N7537_011991 [Penicillium hordei]|uniref:Uncharacterized protein n=1 Tax=Penicillium hordei TaxID=40994 RepID=A0AAD6DMU8_9EURO|nr:uncharacterized protein N7537_011991 [Penicillium hordei]KAJ5589313.1 hypothetical protein N7537_011991 [Penicillium hordei]